MSRVASGRACRMVLRVVGDERDASTRFRVLAHRPALEAAGYRTTVRFSPRRGRLARLADLVRDLGSGNHADLFFIHRRTYPRWLAGRLRGAAPHRVFDLDDAVDLPPPSVEASPRERRRYRSNFEATVDACDLVLCGNEELASRLPHDRFELLPTPVDTSRFAPDRIGPPGAKTVGWVGHSDNLRYLTSIAEPLREVARRHPGLRVVVVADRPPRLEGIEVEFRRWSLEAEVACFDGISVGLMPLDDSPWARSKCAFKALQYLALGIPAVVSPVGMNHEVVRDGESGFHASGAREWVEGLDRLLSQPERARSMGASGRRSVQARYSLEVISRRLLEILESRGLGPRASPG